MLSWFGFGYGLFMAAFGLCYLWAFWPHNLRRQLVGAGLAFLGAAVFFLTAP